MSDRYNGFAVTLDNSLKDEEVQKIVNAMLMIKGIINVEPIVEDISSRFAKNQAKNELSQQILKIIYQY